VILAVAGSNPVGHPNLPFRSRPQVTGPVAGRGAQ
jgi:hypothetical protein